MTKNTHQNHSAGTGSPNGEFRSSHAKKNSTGHWLSQELHLIDIFGKSLFLSYAEIRTIMLDKRMEGILFLTMLALYAVDPHGFRGHIPEYWALSIWLGSTVVLFMTRTVTYALVALAQANSLVKRLYVPALSVVEYGTLFLGIRWISNALAEDHYQFNFAYSFPFLLFSFLMLETFFFRFVVPVVLKRLRGEGAASKPAERAVEEIAGIDKAEIYLQTHPDQPKILTLHDRKVRLDALLGMQSEEHYVHIRTRHETLTVRAKLPTLLEQIPQEYGIRCHRSWWVSRIAMPVIQKCEQGLCLIGTDGCEAPIARSRKKEVQEWLDLNRDW